MSERAIGSSASARTATEVIVVDPATGAPRELAGTGSAATEVQGNAESGTEDLGFPVKAGGKVNISLPNFANGQRGDLQLSTRGALLVQPMFENVATSWSGQTTNTDGLAAVAQATAVRTLSHAVIFNGTHWDRCRKPNGVSRLPSAAASTNAAIVKAAPGDLHFIGGYNAAGTLRYLKLYNKVTVPSVGTDVPHLTFALPAGEVFAFDVGGQYFPVGIAYSLTQGPADTDNTALAAGDVLGLNICFA